MPSPCSGSDCTRVILQLSRHHCKRPPIRRHDTLPSHFQGVSDKQVGHRLDKTASHDDHIGTEQIHNCSHSSANGSSGIVDNLFHRVIAVANGICQIAAPDIRQV